MFASRDSSVRFVNATRRVYYCVPACPWLHRPQSILAVVCRPRGVGCVVPYTCTAAGLRSPNCMLSVIFPLSFVFYDLR